MDSSIFNARTQAKLATGVAADVELYALLCHQLVDGALSVFHLLARMPDAAIARRRLVGLRRDGFLGFLWRHAGDNIQRRRIFRHWLRSWLGGIGR